MQLYRSCVRLTVSIHAPVWVRQLADYFAMRDAEFQFTHPCGCDFFPDLWEGWVTVSIHAPVWVRQIMLNYIHQREGFNSRTRVGATLWRGKTPPPQPVSIHAPVWVRRFLLSGLYLPLMFQFTHPCGCDMTPEQETYKEYGFNSRTRVGATEFNAYKVQDLIVSIHAPVWVRLIRG